MAPAVFACDPAAVPAALPLRRLSRRQYVNTVTDLVRAVAAPEADALLAEISPWLSALPDDTRAGPDKHYGGLTALDQALQQAHADGHYAVARGLSERLTATPGRLERLVGACATGASDEACLTGFIERFGARVLRRPLTADDVQSYRRAAVKVPYEPADYADVAGMLLAAPESFFLVEYGDETSPADPAPLTGHELASRLSYHFWQTAPDDALLARAAAGDLGTEAGYAAEVDRLFKDPRTRDSIGAFFGEWLQNSTLEELDARVGSTVYDQLRGDFTPGPDSRRHYLDEVTDAARYYTFDQPGSFDTFFRSTRSFARTADVAQIYGVPVWDGAGEPPETTGRAGLITRPAFVATGVTGTRPIMKGVFVRKALLCDGIPPPPVEAMNAVVPQASQASTRQRVEDLTGSVSCAGCHASLINPIGFATEGFDAFGRVRTSEALFDAQGAPVGHAAIDTATVPGVDPGDETPSAGPADLVDLMARSPKLGACFARHYHRYTFGRLEDPARDSCALASLETALREGRDLATVLRTVALQPGFKTRSFQ
ncbi:MAG: DUF1592 domain-containing protein [Myxococcales bacterium]|nr:MAG: DUF1592 domain-containing protein [Myxococcales bacterium]